MNQEQKDFIFNDRYLKNPRLLLFYSMYTVEGSENEGEEVEQKVLNFSRKIVPESREEILTKKEKLISKNMK